jgi:glycosyltransferase EpsE
LLEELKEMMIEVSVIMAVYNTENRKILERAIDSILKQSLKGLELIICDDGSTDGTPSLLEEIAKTDNRITLFRNQENMGVSVARNRCIALAKAEYIAIMDADDYSDEKRLEKQLEFLKRHPEYAYVGTAGQYFNDHENESIRTYWFCEFPQKEDFLFTLPFLHASLVFRKQILLIMKGYSEAWEVTRSEDYDLLMRLYASRYYGANLKEILYFIREDEGTFIRRKYRYRLNEFLVKYKGFRNLDLMPKGIFFAIKPMIVGLIPIKLLNSMKSKYYNSLR